MHIQLHNIKCNLRLQAEKMEQRRNFLHPESAAGLQQARSVPPACPWPGPTLPPLSKTMQAGPATTQS